MSIYNNDRDPNDIQWEREQAEQSKGFSYKSVFQLAQDKGYQPFGFPDYYELCRIQKWLRDEHKILMSAFQDLDEDNKHKNGTYGYFYFEIGYLYNLQTVTASYEKPTYEEALLDGIDKALKLLP